MYDQLKHMDTKEVDLPGTVFVRDIESRVLQGIVLQVLSKIEQISLIEGNIFDSLLGRDLERVKGIHVEQEQRGKSVKVTVEINIVYGISIPEKAEEIQRKLADEMNRWTGLHVSSIHIIFKELISPSEIRSSSESESFEPAY